MSRNPRTAFTGWPSGALKAPTGIPKKARNIRLDPSSRSQSAAMTRSHTGRIRPTQRPYRVNLPIQDELNLFPPPARGRSQIRNEVYRSTVAGMQVGVLKIFEESNGRQIPDIFVASHMQLLNHVKYSRKL